MPWVIPGNGDPRAEFLPIGDLKALLEADSLTVFFLDDLGQAPPAVQAACMQLILARRINGHKVSPHVMFIGATNRKADKAHVSGILEPVKSRFVSILELEVDLENWVSWALKAGIETDIIAFIRFRPGLLHDFKPTSDITNSPCPRTWANLSRLMALNPPREAEFELAKGAVGEGAAGEYMAFRKIYKSLPNPDAVLLDPEKADVPEDPATLYALCGALSRRASQQTIERLVRYCNRLPAEFSVLLIRDSVRVDESIVNTRPFIEWASENSSVLI
jgi:hypothetical protein